MSRDGLVINDFSGGLNNAADPSLIASNELAEAVNVVMSRTGKLVSRPPMFTVASKPSGATSLEALGYFRNEDGVVFLVVATQSKTYLYNLSASTWTEIWGYAAEDSTTYLNRLYLINSTNGGGYWSKVSGSYVWTSLIGMPSGNQVHATKGRIYVSSRALGNTSTLRYSNITSISGGTSIDDFPVSNYIDINEGDGELLVKIVEGNSELLLFRSNSTWRLAFGASAEPTDGTLSSLSLTIGADNARSVVEVENVYAVLHAGTLYSFAGYNYYPLNEYNKVQFTAKTGTWQKTTALSKVGQYLLVWYYGAMYCYDTESRIWTEWRSDTSAAHYIEAPRGTFLAAGASITAFGVGGKNTDTAGLLKFVQDYSVAPSENIVCRIKTRTYDIDQPSRFKRLFGWELLMVAVNSIEASIIPIEEYVPDNITWAELQTYTWTAASAASLVWSPSGPVSSVVVTGLPTSNPTPQVIKISGKKTFKRAYFTVIFGNDGSTATSPSRLDGIVLYLTNGRRSAIGQIA